MVRCSSWGRRGPAVLSASRPRWSGLGRRLLERTSAVGKGANVVQQYLQPTGLFDEV
jgi:hypothetical protein